MEITIAEEVQTQSDDHGGKRGGVVLRKWLLMGEAEDGLRFRFFRSKYQDGDDAFQSPRHHHSFQQIRWTETGAVNYAPGQDIPQGDIAYFPRGAFYGPQVKDSGVGLLLQFGFGAELPVAKSAPAAYRQNAAKMEPTTEHGGLEEQPVKIPIRPAGYESAILMYPRAREYYAVGPGAEIKHLGGFYDHTGPNADVRISVVRLSAGGSYTLGADRAQLLWSASQGLKIEGRTYPELTCAYSPRGEDAAIEGVGGVEVYVVEFPRLD